MTREREKTVVKGRKISHTGWNAAGEPLTLARNEGCKVSQDLAGVPRGSQA